MKILKSIYRPFRDLFLQIFPIYLHKKEYRYGFLIHPRDERDVITKYPFLSFAPYWLIRFFTRWYWPVVVTKITGLKKIKSQDEIDGYILTIPLITKQILANRPLAVKRIRQSITLAKRMGIKIVGLGALTASITRGGEDLLDIEGIWITTGHAYTGYNVTRNLFNLEEALGINKESEVVAIVGAAGSIGSISAEIIARRGYKNILLIDVHRKRERVEETQRKLLKEFPTTSVRVAYDVKEIITADFIIAATNTPEALITASMLKPGAVVIDDAQPSDVAYDVLERSDVMAVEAGIVSTPGICSNFNLGLKNKFDNFCCMAEVLILAANEWKSNFVIKKTTLEFVDQIVEWGKELNFELGAFQNRKELIPQEKINRVATVRKKRYNT
ncbi:hypothetical protein COU15_00255 [Candidatus Kaiserbacteria bacterium CG10_big_fil_rev_8_21_14_0_10_45_20]|uniref:Quinate/shikimate 5-dehydrogenase/glutamyl-tRNA reductase domain-containing protein n=1 Tax=Candidatus Kaiserbacteria bacterium CG10_big_fil_rev_8_21_14_0_10_45_20 TaxID=1974607 RepID=A0A2H0UGG9_9BACT|nr:MAG: hypothetical protein COU15_00255 [Candidatus Kaiserbacteria bacterium CG10_big_fil_rev_8_21_14_0_10_45_20]